jgi:hypothetical protein
MVGTTVLVEAGGALVRLRTSEVWVLVVEGALEELIEELDWVTEDDALDDAEDEVEDSLDVEDVLD